MSANMDATRVMIDAQLLELEARTLSLQQQIQELKIQRNACAPIHMLPEDILLHIFAIAQHQRFPSQWYKELTHVCRHWRHIAIQAPTLWTNPTLMWDSKLNDLVLERSKSAGLSIFIGHETSDTSTELALAHIDHIRSLIMHHHEYGLGFILTLLKRSKQIASQLERLEVHCVTHKLWDSRPMFGLSATMFCHLHTLQNLTISNVIFDWGILPLPNLVALEISNVDFLSSVSIHRLLETLRLMPHLRSLAITLRTPSFMKSSTAELDAAVPVLLSHLTSLDLDSSDLSFVQDYLPKLITPQLRELVVYSPPKNHATTIHGDLSQLNTVIASAVGGYGAFKALDSLDLHTESFLLFMRGARYGADTTRVLFGVEGDGPLFMQTAISMLSACCANLTSLVQLKFYKLSVAFDGLLQLSTGLGHIRCVEIEKSQTTALEFIQILSTLPPPDAPQALPFPALESMTFVDINFAGMRNSAALESLCNSLQLRANNGIPITTLRVFGCTIHPTQTDLLRNCVQDFVYTR